MKYHAKVEPYKSMIESHRIVITMGTIDYYSIWLLAKATGLRSNKRRHIKKRGMAILSQAIREYAKTT